MPLPILSTPNEPSPSDLLRHYLRCELHWVRHLAEDEQTLDAGVALANPQLPAIYDANQLRDAVLPDGISPADCVAAVDEHFSSLGVRCAYYVMNPSAAAGQTQPLIEHLQSAGFYRTSTDVYVLGKLGAPPNPSAHDMKIIPSRASFRHFNELAAEYASEFNVPEMADAWAPHLDDSHYDAVLALRDGKAIAHGGVLAVGEMGYLSQIYVTPAQRNKGVAATIVARLIEICARSLFRTVFVDIDPLNEPAIALYKRFGFRKVAESATYRAPWTKK